MIAAHILLILAFSAGIFQAIFEYRASTRERDHKNICITAIICYSFVVILEVIMLFQ